MEKPTRAGAHLGVCGARGSTTAWIHQTPGFGCTGGARRGKGMGRSSRAGGGALRRRKPRRRRPRWPEPPPRPRRPSRSRRSQRCRGPTTRVARRRRDAWPSSSLEHEHGGVYFLAEMRWLFFSGFLKLRGGTPNWRTLGKAATAVLRCIYTRVLFVCVCV